VAEHLAAGEPPEDVNDPDFVPVSAVLAEPGHLDARMFGMTRAEAELLDPQHRLFLELSHTALADSGYDPARYGGDIGVYAGSGEDSYQWRYVRRSRTAMARVGPIGLSVNSHPDYVATFTSFKLGLRGPSLTVHTACSTSLVAVHLACEALRNGECDMAIAGAANLELPLGRGYVYEEGGPTSRDGHCRAFDAAASGTVWGSGGAAVILKRLEDAVTDRDDIRAVIIADAVNNDGSTKVGFTAPSHQGQTAVVAQALSAGGVDPRTIGFVEAHGTGTMLGDPIEVGALSAVYQRHTGDTGWCAIGSVKTNVGHLGPAAGVTGLIKASLAVRDGLIPPSLHYETPNPKIPFGENPFFVNTTPLVWDDGTAPRRAAVSSFGIGGTNAHVIIEQAPAPPPAAAPRGWQLLQLSTRTETALAVAAEALADHLEANLPAAPGQLGDVAYTLRAGRQELSQRLAVVAADEQDAVRALRDKRRWISGSAGRAVPQPVFMFPGQGAQYAGMGAGLYASEQAYRDAVDECCQVLRDGDLLSGSTRQALLTALTTDDDGEALRQTVLAQPALFTVEYALAALWRSWGVTPHAMIGHSIGEYAAATIAGVFGLADALRVVALRGELMQSLPAGAMAAVRSGEAELRGSLPEGASIAAVNGPDACVVSGPPDVIGQFADQLEQAEAGVRLLHTSHAFHSTMTDPVLAAFRDIVASVELKAPRIPFAANRTGRWISAEEATDPSYWARQLRDTVRFGDCVATAAEQGAGIFLECGPGRQLTGLVRMQRRGHTAIPCLPGHGERGADLETLAAAAGQLWVAGCPLEADALGGRGRRLPLPGYPWEREHYWINPDPDVSDGGTAAAPRNRSGQPAAWAGRFTIPVWRQLPPVGRHRPAARVLVLTGDGDTVADGLAGRGSEVIRVRRGDRYATDGAGNYRVRPASREDYESMLGDLSAHGGIPAHIVHCWTLPDPPAAAAEAVWAAQDDGFFSVLSLVQALADVLPEDGQTSQAVRLDVVTAGTQEAVGGDSSRPEHATLAGAVKVLPLEFPWLSAQHIDADPRLAGQPAAPGTGSLADALIEEICAPGTPSAETAERLVALRNGRRWERQFEDVTVPQPGEPVGEETVGEEILLRERGVYLITGGLGGIGITLAAELAERYRARLILVTREGLPPRAGWDAAQTAGAVSARARRGIEAVRAMERSGAEVQVTATDVTDPGAVRTLREEILARYGRIDGIIHAAGVAGGGMAEIKDRGAAESVLRPKLTGTLALRDAFADLTRDFVVLCSSVQAIAGSFGQVDYCAANAFLDAYAGSAHGWTARVVSVNWGAWLKIGMAAETAAPAAFRALQRGQHMTAIKHGLLTERYPAQGEASAWCSGTISPDTHWALADHRMASTGVAILPGTACLEAARCAFEECCPPPGPEHLVELRDVVFTQPLAVPDRASAELRVILASAADGADFEVRSVTDEAESLHARGSAAWVRAPGEQRADLDAIRARCAQREVTQKDLSVSESGLIRFGPHWSSLIRVHQGPREELALLAAPEAMPADPHPWTIHPALLDEAMGSAGTVLTGGFLPFGYGRLLIRRALPACLWSHRQYRDSGSADMATADVTLYDESGREVLHVEDFSVRKVDAAALAGPDGSGTPGEGRTEAIPPSAGADAFRRLLASRLAPQVVISAKPIVDMIVASHHLDYTAVEQELPGPGKAEAGTGGQETPGGPRTQREQAVGQILGDLLGATVAVDEDFFDVGGNSLVAVQLLALLRKQFGVRLPMRRFFANPTVAGIAALVDELASKGDA